MMRFRRYLSASFAAAFLALALLATAAPALAQALDGGPANPSDIQLEVPIPQSALEKGVNAATTGTVRGLADYIGRIYNFTIATVGLVAAVMMIIGGFQYLTSAGDAGKIGAAKKHITDAIIGLVLALGAYTILNTINPALLEFKPLSDRLQPVLTELSFLPWCEEVAAGKPAIPPTPAVAPVPVTPLVAGSESTCGSIGEFRYPGQLQKLNCIYRGTPCGFYHYAGIGEVRKACMQYNLTSAELKDMAKKNPAAKAAECLACSWLGEVKMAQMGYEVGSGVCQKWQTSAAYGPFDRETGHRSWYKEGKNFNNKNYISYCGYSTASRSCVQADMNCPDVAKNNDERPDPQESKIVQAIGSGVDTVTGGHGGAAVSGTVGLVGSAYESAEAYVSIDENFGCEGYDEGEHSISYSAKGNQSLGAVQYLSGTGANLENYPDHLEALCKADPCGEGGIRGCTGSKGLVVGVVHLLSTGKVSGVTNCRNR